MNHLIEMTRSSQDMLFQSARKMPADKLTWKPLDAGRSVLDQLQECALSADMYIALIDSTYSPQFANYEEMGAAMAQLDTLDKCEDACRRMTERLCEGIARMTPEDAGKIHEMPWGSSYPGSVVAGFHDWNMVYHLGQINYIQTLYGDNDMF